MILQGNSYRIPLRDESIHACISSFPYFGLRSYNLPPTIWGGSTGCRHIWGETRRIRVGRNDQDRDTRHTDGRNPATQSLVGCPPQNAITGQFCQLCGAWLGCFGLEPTIALHVANAVAVCREIKRVLRRDGVFFLNYGDSYATGKNGRSAADTKLAGKDDRTFRDKPFSITELPAKNLCLIPFRVALALQDDGWILRSEIPWLKKNSMPSSVTDRPGTAHEHVFMLVKSARYYFDMEAVRRPAVAGYNGSTFTNGKTAKAREHLAAIGQRERANQDGASGRALRTSDPFFDSLDATIAHLQDIRDNGGMLVDSEGLPAALVVNTQSYSAAHYATFPIKLVAPLIQTTPEKVCPGCSQPWKRIVEKEVVTNGAGRKHIAGGDKSHGWEGTPRATLNTTTTGWRPTCKCIQKRAPNFGMKGSELLELADEVAKELAPIPAVILDPFCGSGTVGAAARELGRRFIGIDLSATYLAENALPRSERKMSLKALGQLPMFATLGSTQGGAKFDDAA